MSFFQFRGKSFQISRPSAMATSVIEILSSDIYESGSGGYLSAHTFPDIDVLGTDTVHIAVGFNNNPASEVSGWTSEGNAMTGVVDSINAGVCAVSFQRYLINSAAVTTVSTTPSFKLQAGIVVGLQNVDQTTPVIGTPVTAGGFGTDASASYTGTAGSMLLVAVSTHGDRTFTPQNCTEIENVTHADGSLGSGFLGYVVATGLPQTIGVTVSSGDNWRLAIIELKESAGGGGMYTTELLETVALVDSVLRQTSKVLTDSLAVVDNVTKVTGRTIVETVVLVDTFLKQTQRIFTEVVTVVDTITKLTGKVLTDVVTLVDTITRITSRTFTEVVTLVDTFIKQTQRMFTEVVTLVDEITYIKSATILLTETVTLVDTLVRDMARTITETVVLVDTVIRQTTRQFIESIALVDTVLRVALKFKELVEQITLVDSVTKLTSKVFTEVVTAVDSFTRNIQRTLTETIALVDTVVRQTQRLLSETVTLSDVITRAIGRVLIESITATDSVLRQMARTLSDSVALVESVLIERMGIVLVEIITLTDTFLDILISPMRKGVTILLTTVNKTVTAIRQGFPYTLSSKSDTTVIQLKSKDRNLIDTKDDKTIL